MSRVAYRSVVSLLSLVGMSATLAQNVCDPCGIDFKCVAMRRFQLDGTCPFPEPAFWPGAQYTATVTSFPATVRFVTDEGKELFRYTLSTSGLQPSTPTPPFDLSLLVSGRQKMGASPNWTYGKLYFYTANLH